MGEAHRHHATRPCRPRSSIRQQHRRSIMGCGSSVLAVRTESSNVRPIPERFNTVIDVTDAMRQAGLESSKLLVAVDFTKSNSGTGGPCLHDISTGESNPYQQVISVIGRTLEDFDDDKSIHAYGFGDATTGDHSCFSFDEEDGPSHGSVAEVLDQYKEITRHGIQ